jgi:hypothetical protein
MQLWCEQLNSWELDLRGEVDQLLQLSFSLPLSSQLEEVYTQVRSKVLRKGF